MRAADQNARRRWPDVRGCGWAMRSPRLHPVQRRARNREPLGAVPDMRRARPGRVPAPRPRRRSARSFSTSAMLTTIFVEPGQEFARAVERIDDQEEAPPIALRPAGCRWPPPTRTGRRASAGPGSARMTVSEASSAAVTGDLSALSRRFRSERGTARMAAAAREAISVRPSSSATISDSVATIPAPSGLPRFITSPAHARRPNRLNVPCHL